MYKEHFLKMIQPIKHASVGRIRENWGNWKTTLHSKVYRKHA